MRNRWSHNLAHPLLVTIVLGLIGCRGDSRSAGPAQTEDPMDPIAVAEQERVQTFWSHFREATRFRLDHEFERARKAYRLALENNVDHEDALYYLGNVDLTLENWEEAKASWQRLFKINPSSSRALSQLGALALCRPKTSAFDLSAARSAFEGAHRLNPEETGPTLRLGEVALLEGDLDRAAEFFDAVTGSNFLSAEAHYLKAYTEWVAGRGSEGLAELNRVVADLEALPVSPVMGEGDTGPGQSVSLSHAGGCPLFEPFIESMARSPKPFGPEVFVQYEELGNVLNAENLAPPMTGPTSTIFHPS